MKRKRFVKLMMATGLSRNCVTDGLWLARVTGGYRRYYESWKQFMKFMDKVAHDEQATV